MNICVLNGSPKGNNSITVHTVLYLEKKFPMHRFQYVNVGAQIKRFEKDLSVPLDAIKEADLLLFSYPVYTFLAPSQLHRFIRLLKESGVSLQGKFATQVTTSKHFYDMTAHRYVEDNCRDLGLKVIHGLSADMEDLTTVSGQKDAVDFFNYVLWCMENDVYEQAVTSDTATQHTHRQNLENATDSQSMLKSNQKPHCELSQESDKIVNVWSNQEHNDPTAALSNQKSDDATANCVTPEAAPQDKDYEVVIVADLAKEDTALQEQIDAFIKVCPCKTRLVNLATYPFQGGCLGCFHCAADGKCIYTDGFDTFLREEIQRADAIVYAFTIADHSMGYRFKMYDDRQFCNGHRTVTEGMPFGYLINGNYNAEVNLQTVIEARCQVGHNFLAGVGYDNDSILAMSKRLLFALENGYVPPRNFWGVGGMKIFRDLIWLMRGLMKADHEFYKAHGIYDFPQKQKGKMLLMCLLGAMIRNPKIQKKMGNKMTEGMVAPYKKVISSVEEERKA